VDFVERRYASSSAGERLAMALPYIDQFRQAGADAIVLGCTHFLFLKDTFTQAAGDLSVHDSVEGVCHRAETLLDQGDLRAAPSSAARVSERVMLVTGNRPLEPSWEDHARAFGLTLQGEQEYGV
jgi:glutamate racemase